MFTEWRFDGVVYWGMARRAGRYLFWVLAESAGLSLLSLVVLFTVARTLGPSEFGVAVLAVGLVQMLAMLIDTLLHDAIVQRSDINDSHLHTAFWTCLGLGAAASAAVWVSAPAIGGLFDNSLLSSLVAAAGLSLIFSGTASVPVAVLRRHFLFKALAVRTIYGRLSGAIVAIVLVSSGYGVWSLIAQHVVQAAVNAMLIWRSSPWKPAFAFSYKRLIELLEFGVLSLGCRIAWLSSARLFTILVGYFLGTAAVGYISIAQKVVDTLYDLFSGAAYNLALPIFSRQQADLGTLAQTYGRVTGLAALTVPPMFAGIAVCAPAIVALFLGEGWAGAVPLVQTMAIGTMLQFVLLFGDVAVTAVGRPAYAFAYAVLSFTFVIGTFLIYPPDDQLHAAVIWGLRMVVVGPFLIWSVNHLLGSKATADFFGGLIAPLIAILIMFVALSVTSRFLAGAAPIYVLLIQIPLGVTLYGAVISVVDRPGLKRLLDLMSAGLSGNAQPKSRVTPQA